jgi:hypothetical protein
MTETEGNEGMVEEPTEAEPTDDASTETQTEPPTQEQDVDALIAQAKAEVEAEWQKKYQGLQKVVSKKDRELQKYKQPEVSPTQTPNTNLEAMKLVVSDLEARDAELGTVNPRIAQIKQMIDEEEKRQVYEQQVVGWQRTVESAREKIEAQIEDAGLDPNDPKLDSVWDKFDIAAYQTGNFDAVNKRLERVLKSVKPKEEKEPVGEKDLEEKVKKLAEEEKKKWLIEQGYLSSDVGPPAGAMGDDAEFLKRYSAGEENDHKRAKELLDKIGEQPLVQRK